MEGCYEGRVDEGRVGGRARMMLESSQWLVRTVLAQYSAPGMTENLYRLHLPSFGLLECHGNVTGALCCREERSQRSWIYVCAIIMQQKSPGGSLTWRYC